MKTHLRNRQIDKDDIDLMIDGRKKINDGNKKIDALLKMMKNKYHLLNNKHL